MFDLVNTQGFPATAWSPFLVQKHKNCPRYAYILLYISKYLLTFAPVIVLTLNTTLMMYKVSYTDSADQVFSFVSADCNTYHFQRALEKCEIKSFTVSLHEPAQKGGQYEQQPE